MRLDSGAAIFKRASNTRLKSEIRRVTQFFTIP